MRTGKRTSVSATALASLSLRFSQRSASSSTKFTADVGTCMHYT